jgi:hypothetical protein
LDRGVSRGEQRGVGAVARDVLDLLARGAGGKPAGMEVGEGTEDCLCTPVVACG